VTAQSKIVNDFVRDWSAELELYESRMVALERSLIGVVKSIDLDL